MKSSDRGELMIDERPWKGVVITFTGVEQKVGQHLTLERGLMEEPNVSSCY
jgi:hypothetical protein